MEYNGFEVLPTGNADLSILPNGNLKVSNILDSGLDGVLINVENKGNYTIHFGDLSSISQNQGVLKTATLNKNPLGQVVPFFESFKWFDPSTNKISLGYNLDLLPNEFNVFGKLEGGEVFNVNSSDLPIPPDDDQPTAILGTIISLIAVGVSIWALLRTKKTASATIEYDSQGNFAGATVTISEDPTPFEVEVNNTIYLVDEVGIQYDLKIPQDLIGNPSIGYSIVAEQITGNNLSEFEITSIESV